MDIMLSVIIINATVLVLLDILYHSLCKVFLKLLRIVFMMALLTNFIMEGYHCEEINPQIIKLHKKKNCELPW